MHSIRLSRFIVLTLLTACVSHAEKDIRKLLADCVQGGIGEAEDVYFACNGYLQHRQKIMSIYQQMPSLLESGQVNNVLNKYGVTP